MAKREIPLFIIDKSRWHSQGECDFLVCTDIDNAFVARIDYVSEDEADTDTMKIVKGTNGINLKLEIKRITGQNPTSGAIRTLMKKGCDYISENGRLRINTTNPSAEDCINFLNVLIDANHHKLQEAGSDYNARKVVATSLQMLEAIKDRLK